MIVRVVHYMTSPFNGHKVLLSQPGPASGGLNFPSRKGWGFHVRVSKVVGVCHDLTLRTQLRYGLFMPHGTSIASSHMCLLIV